MSCSSQIKEENYSDEKGIDLSLFIKDKTLYNYFNQTEDGLYVYTDTNQKEVDFFIENSLFDLPNKGVFTNMSDSVFLSLIKPNTQKINYWEVLDVESFSRTKMTSLKGLKIALDPGHVALDMAMAEIEGKYLKIGDYELYEADLTLKTAYYLKGLLEQEGAEVFVTRTETGEVYKGITYDKWLKNDFYNTLDSLLTLEILDSTDVEKLGKYYKGGSEYGRKVIFHKVFKHLDTRHRAKIINEWKPDVTLVMHYNVDEQNEPWEKTTTKNFAMMFVPGGFCKGELETSEDRLAFVRILLSENQQNSLKVSNFIAKSVTRTLNIPLANTQDAEYLVQYTNKITDGVYARNLALTRLVHSPICYAEALYQDNEKELKLLTKDDDRIKEVAKAYFEGLKNYYAK